MIFPDVIVIVHQSWEPCPDTFNLSATASDAKPIFLFKGTRFFCCYKIIYSMISDGHSLKGVLCLAPAITLKTSW